MRFIAIAIVGLCVGCGPPNAGSLEVNASATNGNGDAIGGGASGAQLHQLTVTTSSGPHATTDARAGLDGADGSHATVSVTGQSVAMPPVGAVVDVAFLGPLGIGGPQAFALFDETGPIVVAESLVDANDARDPTGGGIARAVVGTGLFPSVGGCGTESAVSVKFSLGADDVTLSSGDTGTLGALTIHSVFAARNSFVRCSDSREGDIVTWFADKE